MDTVYVDGFDLFDLGLMWAGRTGYRSESPVTPALVAIPGSDRGKRIQGTWYDQERRISLTGTIVAASVAELYARVDEIKARMAGEFRLSFPDDDARYVNGRLNRFAVGDWQAAGAVTPAAPYTMEVICADPRLWAETENVEAFGDPLPLGTAVVRPTVTINGPSVNPVVTLFTFDGQEYSTFAFDGSIVSGRRWEVDGETGTVREWDGSQWLNAVADWSGGLPILDPAVASNWAASSWPNMVLVSGTAGSGEVRYRRAFK